jgi:plasmid stability protein
VKNIPDELYEGLRHRAKKSHRSIAAEVLVLLEENIPTAKKLRARRNLFLKLKKMRSAGASPGTLFRSTEEQREGRSR